MAKPPHAHNNNNYENHVECFLFHEYTESFAVLKQLHVGND